MIRLYLKIPEKFVYLILQDEFWADAYTTRSYGQISIFWIIIFLLIIFDNYFLFILSQKIPWLLIYSSLQKAKE